ncbi:trk system potassium uptake protein TrkH [Albidovulum inexpectatum]|uniref:Trk system potassium uptake protein TrkH n=2 Tax=Albidovulum inexpectatum TaxID=196587 RepID=A0A2S5JJC5_9RHOB|nr:trk system potassium uptake protein TrkH [Albidovulum inexpectatum]
MIILMGGSALAMLVPAIHAFLLRDYSVSRAFLYSALIFLILTAMIAIASVGNRPRQPARDQLLTLLGAYAGLPLILAVPFSEAIPDTHFTSAWWEMISSLTTTGASLYAPDRLEPSLHLWRAMVGWMGGFFVLVTAVAILAPMNLGGFEVLRDVRPRFSEAGSDHWARQKTASEQLVAHAADLLPAYLGLTLALMIGLVMAGETALVAACHAMSVLSTSGITPLGGLDEARSGVLGEALILAFMALAVSRRLIPTGHRHVAPGSLREDPEMRMAILLCTAVPALLFLRHWFGALSVDDVGDIRAAFGALWGTLFTVLSFLTTTGFESAHWMTARNWSGLETPGLVLAGLAVIGGGVATTAGGVKLLRVYAIFLHGEREVERLIHPNSIGGGGVLARRLRRQGARMAWIFFMLFALSIAVTMLALSLAGLNFVQSTTFAVAALSTTGPLAGVTAAEPLSWAALDGPARTILAAAMVLGRLETLAIVALLNPDFWRN